MRISIPIFLRKLNVLLRCARQYWNSGGYTVCNIMSVDYGSILKDKRVLITGGTSGIGLSIAEKCISCGAEVVITGRNTQKMHAAKVKIDSPKLRVVEWDISDVKKSEEIVRDVDKFLGGEIDVLVNNAGILVGANSLSDLTDKKWDKIINVNGKGTVFVTKYMVDRWIKRGLRAKVINISSMRGALGVKDGPYGFSKWGLNGLTEGLGKELASKGIIVNGIAPGIINTESVHIGSYDFNENIYFERIPVGRVGHPHEIAELALFLMSDASNFIVGQTISCDGGYTLRS